MFPKRGRVTQKRVAWIETVIERLTRRAKSRVSAMVTPYPISACMIGDIGGAVLKYMFPLDGILGVALVTFNKKPKTQTGIDAKIESDLGGTSKYFPIEKKSTSIDLNIPIKAGDRLTVTVDIVDSKEGIDEVWIAFTWTPNVKDTELKTVLIEELEKGL